MGVIKVRKEQTLTIFIKHNPLQVEKREKIKTLIRKNIKRSKYFEAVTYNLLNG